MGERGRDIGGLVLTSVAVGPMDNNAYLLRCAATGHQVLVDAAAEPLVLLGLLGAHPLDLVVTTHGHADHWQALREVLAATGAQAAAHPLDAAMLPVAVDVPVEHGGTVAVGEVALEVIHLRGHTPGSIALAHTPADGPVHLFTGDSLFPGGVGNTWGDAAAFAQLFADVTTRIFDRFGDDAVVHPGHGRATTLGAERPQLGQWASRGW